MRDETELERRQRRAALYYWLVLLVIIAIGGLGLGLLVFK